MKFTKILTIAFTLAFAYAQSTDADIVSDVESNQVPDYAGVEAQNAYDPTAYGGENSDDYGDADSVNALDGMGEGSDDDSTESNPVSSAPVTDAPSSPGVIVPESSTPPESTVPEATAPEVDAAANENAVQEIIEQKDEIPQDEIPLNMVFNGASGEAAPVAAAAQEAGQEAAKEKPISALDDETKTETSIDPAKIASGLVGAAALSSAGILFMVKRAKRRGLESVRSQISMA
jgi:hypothetical protein